MKIDFDTYKYIYRNTTENIVKSHAFMADLYGKYTNNTGDLRTSDNTIYFVCDHCKVVLLINYGKNGVMNYIYFSRFNNFVDNIYNNINVLLCDEIIMLKVIY